MTDDSYRRDSLEPRRPSRKLLERLDAERWDRLRAEREREREQLEAGR